MRTKVRVNSWYIFNRAGMDRLDPRAEINISEGQLVQVKNCHGCPPANTMGQCYVFDTEGKFIGMVDTYSLTKATPEQRKAA